MVKKFCIVIPCVDIRPNSGDLLDNLLGSIAANKINEISEVIVCWDGTSERFRHNFNEKYGFLINLINDKKRLNYSKNSNKGLRLAHKELKLPVLLCNQDVELPSREAIEFLTSPPEPSVVSPRAVKEFQEVEAAPSWEFTETRKMFSFHCPYISLEVLEAIGYIDPGFVTFNDDLYLIRAKLKGFKTYTCNIPVIHKGSFVDQTANGGSMCGAYDGERLNIDHHRFKYMWQIPESIPHSQYQDWVMANHKWNEGMRVV